MTRQSHQLLLKFIQQSILYKDFRVKMIRYKCTEFKIWPIRCGPIFQNIWARSGTVPQFWTQPVPVECPRSELSAITSGTVPNGLSWEKFVNTLDPGADVPATEYHCCYIDVGDSCWRRNMLVSTFRCWWPIHNIQNVTNIKKVTNITILSPTSTHFHHHKVSNIPL